mgnify:CR=1 FL=1
MPVKLQPVLYRILPDQFPVDIAVETVYKVNFLQFSGDPFSELIFKCDPDSSVLMCEVGSRKVRLFRTDRQQSVPRGGSGADMDAIIHATERGS